MHAEVRGLDAFRPWPTAGFDGNLGFSQHSVQAAHPPHHHHHHHHFELYMVIGHANCFVTQARFCPPSMLGRPGSK